VYNGLPLIPRNRLERKAARIQDPVERLRYLQRHAGSGQPAVPSSRKRRLRKLPILSFALLLGALIIPGFKASSTKDTTEAPQPAADLPHAPADSVDVFTNVWLVENTPQFEVYSNGLRIDDRYTVSNQKRLFYPVYQRGAIDPTQPEWRTEPAGIVYHTTESDQVVFEPDQNGKLKRVGQGVLNYVQQNRSYHFLIDRFGQVYRVVPESDIANHAGFSVWADRKVLYVNLNSSFFGIAFETQTQRQEDQPSANSAQIHAARILTEMLRGKYHIPEANCVTHAQVSVNPDRMLIGYHTDWAGNFPFHEVGLRDNYAAPSPSIYAFGFDYDPVFVHATGVRIWEGLAMAEDQLRTDAIARGVPVSHYRSILREKYKQIIETLKAASDAEENSHGK
jgi:hypothetical protein